MEAQHPPWTRPWRWRGTQSACLSPIPRWLRDRRCRRPAGPGPGPHPAGGQAHAEIMALLDAAARGHSVAGATAYVTLEPCSHHGRTAPCCDALVAAA